MQCRALLMAENQINFDLCILCQTQKNEQSIDNPASHEKVVEFVKERAKLMTLHGASYTNFLIINPLITFIT